MARFGKRKVCIRISITVLVKKQKHIYPRDQLRLMVWGLKHVTDVVKIIDILKIVESNDDESDTAVDVNLGGYCE